jgi:hypothetical protein
MDALQPLELLELDDEPQGLDRVKRDWKAVTG